MTLVDRIKEAYAKMDTLPNRLDCYDPLTVLFKSEYGVEPTPAKLQIWMVDTVFGSQDKLNGFLTGFGCDVPSPPSNGREFTEGFHEGRALVRALDC
jgi:hypothetical protein